MADVDTAEIIADLAVKAGVNVANRYNADFDSLYGRLEVFPEIGAPRTTLGTQARILVVLPYVVIYEYSRPDNLLTVRRIIHGRRKITFRILRGRS